MEIQKEIFEEFFKKLQKEGVPDSIITNLMDLWQKGKIDSQQILEAIKIGFDNVSKN